MVDVQKRCVRFRNEMPPCFKASKYKRTAEATFREIGRTVITELKHYNMTDVSVSELYSSKRMCRELKSRRMRSVASAHSTICF